MNELVELFEFDGFVGDVAAGRLPPGEAAGRLQRLVGQAMAQGAERIARALLDGLLPESGFIRRVVAWYLSRVNPQFLVRVLPEGCVQVEEWDLPDWQFLRQREEYTAVCRDGARRRGSLLILYVVLQPHDQSGLRRVLAAVRGALRGRMRGHVWYSLLPLPPQGQLGEFDA